MMPTDEIFELSGKITFNDVLRFQYFHCLRRIWWFVILVTAFLLGVLGLAVVLSFLLQDSELARATSPVALIAVLWIAFVGLVPFLGARRQFKTMVGFDEPLAFTFSEDGIHTVTAHSSGETSWKPFWKICEANTFFCMYFSAGSAWVIPKRFFKDLEQQRNWRALVNEKITPKQILRPGVVGRLL